MSPFCSLFAPLFAPDVDAPGFETTPTLAPEKMLIYAGSFETFVRIDINSSNDIMPRLEGDLLIGSRASDKSKWTVQHALKNTGKGDWPFQRTTGDINETDENNVRVQN
jgi:hypothetical protein